MPDYTKSTPQSAARGRRTNGRAQHPTVCEVQIAIYGAVIELRRVDQRLAEIRRDLPERGSGFEMLAELGGVVECVRTDLLADAIDTLTTFATATELELQGRLSERQLWLRMSGV